MAAFPAGLAPASTGVSQDESQDASALSIQRSPHAFDFLVKIVLLGDSGVGKSCLLKRFSERQFISSHVTTIGVDFEIRTVDLDGRVAKLQIWDTAGQERFRNIVTSYYRGAHAIMLVWDVTDPQSLKNLSAWLHEVRQYASDDVQLLLVANKVDLPAAVEYSPAQLSEQFGMKCIQTSAKTAQNVDRAFHDLAKQYVEFKSKQLKAKINERFAIDSEPLDGPEGRATRCPTCAVL